MEYREVEMLYATKLQQLRDKMNAAYSEYYSPKGICSKCGKEFTFITTASPLLCAECLISKLTTK
jgi:DNA-directed RNA polymerase subunit RPC12/RpoP